MLHSALTTILKGRLHFISSEPQMRKLQLRRAHELPMVTKLEREEPGSKTQPVLLFCETTLSYLLYCSLRKFQMVTDLRDLTKFNEYLFPLFEAGTSP